MIQQGTKFYVATRISFVRDNNDKITYYSSNSLFNGYFDRVRKGEYLLAIPPDFTIGYSPRVICHYASDKLSKSGGTTLADFLNDTYAVGGTDYKMQLHCSSGNLILDIGPDFQFNYYLPIFFTDMNTDIFADPYYAVITLICI